MLCVLGNAQLTLHSMRQAGHRKRIYSVAPADVIWAVGMFAPERFRPCPATMALLGWLMSERSSDPERHEQMVVPLLDRFFGEFPEAGHPAVAPKPSVEELATGRTAEVASDRALVQTYRRGDSGEVIRFDYRSMLST